MSETNKRPPIGPLDYAMALFAQDACNLAAMAVTFGDVCQRIMYEGASTEAVWKHPIVILYVNKFESLVHSNGSFATYSDAYQVCKDRSQV